MIINFNPITTTYINPDTQQPETTNDMPPELITLMQQGKIIKSKFNGTVYVAEIAD